MYAHAFVLLPQTFPTTWEKKNKIQHIHKIINARDVRRRLTAFLACAYMAASVATHN